MDIYPTVCLSATRRRPLHSDNGTIGSSRTKASSLRCVAFAYTCGLGSLKSALPAPCTDGAPPFRDLLHCYFNQLMPSPRSRLFKWGLHDRRGLRSWQHRAAIANTTTVKPPRLVPFVWFDGKHFFPRKFVPTAIHRSDADGRWPLFTRTHGLPQAAEILLVPVKREELVHVVGNKNA